jgi:hypothetical protein
MIHNFLLKIMTVQKGRIIANTIGEKRKAYAVWAWKVLWLTAPPL